jgi:hypothetical protein
VGEGRVGDCGLLIPGADPGFQVIGGVLKKFRENFGGILCEKSRLYAKKIIFFPILGGRGCRVRPPFT